MHKNNNLQGGAFTSFVPGADSRLSTQTVKTTPTSISQKLFTPGEPINFQK